MRAVPLGATHSRFIAAGMLASVTRLGVSASDNCRSMVFSPGTTALVAPGTVGGGPVRQRLQIRGQGAGMDRGRIRSIPGRFTQFGGGGLEAGHKFGRRWARGLTSKGLRVGSRRPSASAMIASFLSWSSGTKLESVSA